MRLYEPVFSSVLGVGKRHTNHALVVCPFHSDSSPSLSINLDSGLWFCHGCGEKGNAKTFTQRIGGQDISDEGLCNRVSLFRMKLSAIRKSRSWEPPKEVVFSSMYAGEDVWESERGISKKSVAKFGLGYSVVDHALLIPVRDSYGKPVGVIKRFIDPNGGPKYKYPLGFPRASTVYGLHLVQGDSAVLVEGALDAVAADAVGFPAVATLGCQITAEQAIALRRHGVKRIIVAFDNDVAGRKAVAQMRRTLWGFSKSYVDWSGRSEKDISEIPEWERGKFLASAK